MSVKWKELESYNSNGCDIKIEARFITKGKDISQSIVGGALYTDVIMIKALIIHGNETRLLSAEAYEGSWTVKEKWYLRRKPYNIKKCFELELKKMKEDVEKCVNTLTEDARNKIRDVEITDGLPDSLNGL